MSIIIVGVGEEDFSAMEALDGDDREQTRKINFYSYLCLSKEYNTLCHILFSLSKKLEFQKYFFLLLKKLEGS